MKYNRDFWNGYSVGATATLVALLIGALCNMATADASELRRSEHVAIVLDNGDKTHGITGVMCHKLESVNLIWHCVHLADMGPTRREALAAFEDTGVRLDEVILMSPDSYDVFYDCAPLVFREEAIPERMPRGQAIYFFHCKSSASVKMQPVRPRQDT